jgi:ubiquinol-cytochrome c reductase iron-sulfur subunit
MLSFVAKSSNLSPYLKATVTAVAGAKQALSPSAVLASNASATYPTPVPSEPLSGDTLRRQAPTSGNVTVTSGVRSASFVRYAHTDIRIPDFSDYRRAEVKDSKARNRDSAPARNSFTYMIVGSKGNSLR